MATNTHQCLDDEIIRAFVRDHEQRDKRSRLLASPIFCRPLSELKRPGGIYIEAYTYLDKAISLMKENNEI